MLDTTRESHADAEKLEADHPECCGNGAPGWAVVRTHPQAERWANANLRQRGYETYLPLALVLRRDRLLHSLTHRVEVALFPRYLFLRSHNRRLWRPIRETPGVHSVLNNGSQLQYASDASVELVRAAEAAAATPLPGASRWRLGDPCQLAHGPFQGLPAAVLELDREMVLIGVLFLGQLRNVWVAADSLEARSE